MKEIDFKQLSCVELVRAGITKEMIDELNGKTDIYYYEPSCHHFWELQTVEMIGGRELSPELITWLGKNNFLEKPDYTKVPEGLKPLKNNCEVSNDRVEWNKRIYIKTVENGTHRTYNTNTGMEREWKYIRPLEGK